MSKKKIIEVLYVFSESIEELEKMVNMHLKLDGFSLRGNLFSCVEYVDLDNEPFIMQKTVVVQPMVKWDDSSTGEKNKVKPVVLPPTVKFTNAADYLQKLKEVV